MKFLLILLFLLFIYTCLRDQNLKKKVLPTYHFQYLTSPFKYLQLFKICLSGWGKLSITLY